MVNKKASPKLAQCTAETSVVVDKHEYSRRFGRGAVVDLNESIGQELTLGDVVRSECFGPVGSVPEPKPEPPPAKLEAKLEADEVIEPADKAEAKGGKK